MTYLNASVWLCVCVCVREAGEAAHASNTKRGYVVADDYNSHRVKQRFSTVCPAEPDAMTTPAVGGSRNDPCPRFYSRAWKEHARLHAE